MANILDIFSIGWDSKGLKDFNGNLKKTRSDLDKAEGDVKALEQELKRLDKIGAKDSDTFKDVSKKLEEAQKNVKKFSDEIKTMEGKSEFQLNKLRQNFMKVAKAVGAIAAVTVAVKRSMAMYEQAEQIGYLAQKADIAVESLQRLGNAAARFGGNTEASASTVQSLNTKETKEKIVNAGIKLGATPEQTLENIAAKMETLKTDAEKINLADSLGIDEGTTRLLIEGVQRYREELKRTEKYKLYTKDDIERMRDYRQVQADIRMGIESIHAAIARLLLPAITTVAKGIRAVTDWLAEHEGAVKIVGMFVAIAAGAGLLAGAIKGVNLALGLLMKNPIAIQILLWSTLITGLIAVFQDLITFIHGGDSAIGDLWESWGYDLEQIRAGFEIWGERIKRWWNNFLAIFDKNRTFQEDPANISTIKQLKGDDLIKYRNYKKTKELMNGARQSIMSASNNPLNGVSQGTIQNYNSKNATNTSQKTTNIGSITVNTQATNGAEVAKDIQKISQFDDGRVA